MTLLEAVIGFVLLSVVGIVCLDQTRGSMQLQIRSAEWTAAVARAESAMSEALVVSPAERFASNSGTSDLGADEPSQVRQRRPNSPSVSREPWRAGIDRVTVTVSLESGGTYMLARLVPVAQAGAR